MFKGHSTNDELGTCSFSPPSLVVFKLGSSYPAGALNTTLLHFLARTCPVLCHGLLPAAMPTCPFCLGRAANNLGDSISSPLRQPHVPGVGVSEGKWFFFAAPLFQVIRVLFLPKGWLRSPCCYWGSTWIYRTCRNITFVEAMWFTHISLGCWYLILYDWNQWEVQARAQALEAYECYRNESKRKP